MSGISGVGSSDSSSLLYLLYLQNNGAASAADGASGAAACPGAGDSNSASSSAALANNSSASGNSTTANLSDLRSQIESAVAGAVNSLDDTADPAEVFKAVRDAVSSTLNANGINPQSSRGHGHHAHHHHAASADPGQGIAAPGATSDGSGDSDGADNDTSQAGLTNSNQNRDLLAVLFELGDQAVQPGGASVPNGNAGQSGQPTSLAAVLSASTNSTGNNPDFTKLFGQLFANFPNGSGLNLQA
jgi:hypothetical protein